MNTKKPLIKLKKVPYHLALILLTTGASIILGFLSFSGMFALLPVVSLAMTALVLSVAYEGEIYLQNIKGALSKLFKYNYLKNYLAREFLLEHFPKNINEECPEFFKVYAQLLLKLNSSPNKQLKKQIKKRLKNMEELFALYLFPTPGQEEITDSAYVTELKIWLSENKQTQWQTRFNQRQAHFQKVAAFSSVSALFMGIGSTYLMVEAFSSIPFFTAIPFTFWPLIIIPMAIIAGAAYGLLTYNTITDLINNDTIKKWYTKIHTGFQKEGFSWRNVFMASTSILLIGLALALTVCTAGTWWTIATNARPLFDWMRKMPSFIMGVINPIITGISAVFFNIQNTAESIEKLDEALDADSTALQDAYNTLKQKWKRLYKTENWLQIANPFRLLKLLTITPLRIILFFGHLLSIALTADRMPGIPQIIAALIAFICEGFEDGHYFVGGTPKQSKDEAPLQKEHDTNLIIQRMLKKRLSSADNHSHELDIPTKILYILATPLDILALGWDYLARKLIGQKTSVDTPKQPTPTTLDRSNAPLPTEAATQPSLNCQIEHINTSIEKQVQKKYTNKVWFGTKTAENKKNALRELQQHVRHAKTPEHLTEILTTACTNPVFNQHRYCLFARQNSKANDQIFIEKLPQRILII